MLAKGSEHIYSKFAGLYFLIRMRIHFEIMNLQIPSSLYWGGGGGPLQDIILSMV
jgi:hypothetical protein